VGEAVEPPEIICKPFGRLVGTGSFLEATDQHHRWRQLAAGQSMPAIAGVIC
jgi:hypothetical protein